MSNTILNHFYENEYVTKPSQVVGFDEAGFGPWFGPLSVAGVILPDNIVDILNLPENKKIAIKDSKKMTEKNRKLSAAFIQKHAVWYNVSLVSSECIDKHNHLYCDMSMISTGIRNTPVTTNTVIVDGSRFYNVGPIPDHIRTIDTVVAGDSKYMQIAAASILAKVAHDEWLAELIKLNPLFEMYSIDKHKGYVNASHIKAVETYGLTSQHRTTWNVKSVDFSKVKANEFPVILPTTIDVITSWNYISTMPTGDNIPITPARNTLPSFIDINFDEVTTPTNNRLECMSPQTLTTPRAPCKIARIRTESCLFKDEDLTTPIKEFPSITPTPSPLNTSRMLTPSLTRASYTDEKGMSLVDEIRDLILNKINVKRLAVYKAKITVLHILKSLKPADAMQQIWTDLHIKLNADDMEHVKAMWSKKITFTDTPTTDILFEWAFIDE